MDWKKRTDRVATTFIWFITAWLLLVGLSERQSVCNKIKKFRGTSSKDYWRLLKKLHSLLQNSLEMPYPVWSNSSLSNSKWCTIWAFNIITLTGPITDRSRLDWPDHRPILPSLAALFSNLSPSTKDMSIRLGNLRVVLHILGNANVGDTVTWKHYNLKSTLWQNFLL